ncbi:MAG: chemotaxis protein CheW [Polyangiaceae bacterium]
MSAEAEGGRATVWVHAVVSNYSIAVPAHQVREMVTLDEHVYKPITHSNARGLWNLRGRVVTLLDLRVLLGQRSATAELNELCETLVQRKRDHEAWLDALTTSVRDGVPFTKARDPSQCAFGKWYDSFRTDNAVLRMQLARLDAPHRAIHALADATLGKTSQREREVAIQQLEQAKRGLLKDLLRFLDECIGALRSEHREVVLVLERGDPGFGMVVDAVIGVRRIDPTEIAQVQSGALGEIEHALLGITKLENRTSLLLDLERLVANAG